MEETFPGAPPQVANKKSQPAPTKPARDNWDKIDIIFKFVGALGTAVVVGLVGIFGSSFLARQQEAETNLRLYTELMSRREEADTSLRKEMFNSIITNFLKPSANQPPEKRVLNIEMLAYNFHDSLDLGPLFKDVYNELELDRTRNQPYIDRLTRVTRDVVDKQVAMLAEAGGKRDGNIIFEQLKDQPGGRYSDGQLHHSEIRPGSVARAKAGSHRGAKCKYREAGVERSLDRQKLTRHLRS